LPHTERYRGTLTVIPVQTGIHGDAVGFCRARHRIFRCTVAHIDAALSSRPVTGAVGPGVRRGDGPPLSR